jgi:hypothetical protein
MAAYMDEVMEFFLSSRLKVMVITPASMWVRMSDMVVLVVCRSGEKAY